MVVSQTSGEIANQWRESVLLEEMSRSRPSPALEVDGTVRISPENSIARWRGLPVAISLDSGSHCTNQGHQSDCLAELLRLESLFAGDDGRLAGKREVEGVAVALWLSRKEGEKKKRKSEKRKKERKILEFLDHSGSIRTDLV
ncbi:hypothetical protein JCGZ_12827 [Jatropha curcas]|uniref:Uncharacterized protein n=1 Tax=Jatropha curcas TaxID=180498 RepID=A0A067KR31_JATCU|nr:hypothetical protein JCGZ_12827 [Jatropha curcas]